MAQSSNFSHHGPTHPGPPVHGPTHHGYIVHACMDASTCMCMHAHAYVLPMCVRTQAYTCVQGVGACGFGIGIQAAARPGTAAVGGRHKSGGLHTGNRHPLLCAIQLRACMCTMCVCARTHACARACRCVCTRVVVCALPCIRHSCR